MKKWAFLFFFLLLTANVMVAQTTTYKVGDCEVYLLSDGQQSGNASILIGATPQMIDTYLPQATFANAYNAFLIKTPDNIILVDAGTGKKLFDNLHQIGVAPEQITQIYLTHMHGDHIGGLMREEKPAFSQAFLHLSAVEYDYWTNTDLNSLPENRRRGFESARSILAAYGERVKQLEPLTLQQLTADKETLQPIQLYGHTPGHIGFELSSGKDKLFIWGDLTHAMAIQMPCPEVAVTYDIDPVKAVAIRKEALDYIVRNSLPIAGMHIAYPAIGTVRKQPQGYQYTPLTPPEETGLNDLK